MRIEISYEGSVESARAAGLQQPHEEARTSARGVNRLACEGHARREILDWLNRPARRRPLPNPAFHPRQENLLRRFHPHHFHTLQSDRRQHRRRRGIIRRPAQKQRYCTLVFLFICVVMRLVMPVRTSRHRDNRQQMGNERKGYESAEGATHGSRMYERSMMQASCITPGRLRSVCYN